MSNLTCPKCGGTDSFVSQRNIVKGRGIYQSGKMRGFHVCRVCDEIMTGRATSSMPEMSASEKRKFWFPHLALFVISLSMMLFAPNVTFYFIGFTLAFLNLPYLAIHIFTSKRRVAGTPR